MKAIYAVAASIVLASGVNAAELAPQKAPDQKPSLSDLSKLSPPQQQPQAPASPTPSPTSFTVAGPTFGQGGTVGFGVTDTNKDSRSDGHIFVNPVNGQPTGAGVSYQRSIK